MFEFAKLPDNSTRVNRLTTHIHNMQKLIQFFFISCLWNGVCYHDFLDEIGMSAKYINWIPRK